MDFLLRNSQISRDKIVVFGRSLGGAVAIYLASHPYYSQQIHSVFIENTFTSLPEIGAVVIGIPIIRLLPYWCFKNQVSFLFFMLLPFILLNANTNLIVDNHFFVHNKHTSLIKEILQY